MKLTIECAELFAPRGNYCFYVVSLF